MDSKEQEIDKYIKKLQKSINSGTYDKAESYTRIYFSQNLPCTIKISNKKPHPSKEEFEKYLNDQEAPTDHIKRNEEIYKKLIKVGHPADLANEASTGVLSMEEALKKLEGLKKKKGPIKKQTK